MSIANCVLLTDGRVVLDSLHRDTDQHVLTISEEKGWENFWRWVLVTQRHYEESQRIHIKS